jgi:uncharacterized protein (DUF2252 family)
MLSATHRAALLPKRCLRRKSRAEQASHEFTFLGSPIKSVQSGFRGGMVIGMDKHLTHAQRVGATSSPEERRKVGLSLRQRVPRSAQAEWTAPANRVDPVAILIEQGRNRIQELLPVRYARMKADPFAFLRGAAAIMAIDLEKTPSAGIRLQACGDAHLANFGTYATPEGTPVFDINDFDETLPAPFEWDVKRLAASLVVAGRVAQSSKKECMALARTAARAYREHMAELAPLPPLVAWSRCIDLAEAIAHIDSAELRDKLKGRLAKIVQSGAEQFGLVEERNGAFRIREKLPLVRHLDKHELRAREALSSYAGTLQEDRRVLLQRYALQDVAFKAVGVGSVGTFCAIALLVSGGGAPLLLQIKEAQQSVLAPSAGASEYANHGQRVVVGQRILQAATDVFLGWTQKPIQERHFYVRRLKDSRLADIGTRLEVALPFYAELCGRTLARAHARAGDAAVVAGYMGSGTAFDEAIGEFAMTYADQTDRDWKAFLTAIEAGRIVAEEP